MSEIFAELLGRPRFRDSPRHDVMAHLCARLSQGPWWRGLDGIKVTGSNGKGSVATMTAAILRAAGVHVGLTVSPHFVRPEERIQIDGEPVSERDLVRAMARLRDRLDSGPAPALAFESVTALAFEVFSEAQVETVVAEAGIGGRHDATRHVPGSTSVLVSVDLEHRHVLGDSLEAIAVDKADLASSGSRLLVGSTPPAIRDVLAEHCRHRGVEIAFLDQVARVRLQGAEGATQVFDLELREPPPARWDSLRLSLLGAAQAGNAALAATAARRWLSRHRPDLEPGFDSALRAGLAELSLPGRFEKLCDSPPLWVDLAHTPSAVRHLVETASRAIDRPVLLVLGTSSDKDPAQLAPPLLGLSRRVLVTRAAERGGETAPLLELVRATGKPVEICESVGAAVERAMELARSEGLAVLVAGGLFLASEAARHWQSVQARNGS